MAEVFEIHINIERALVIAAVLFAALIILWNCTYLGFMTGAFLLPGAWALHVMTMLLIVVGGFGIGLYIFTVKNLRFFPVPIRELPSFVRYSPVMTSFGLFAAFIFYVIFRFIGLPTGYVFYLWCIVLCAALVYGVLHRDTFVNLIHGLVVTRTARDIIISICRGLIWGIIMFFIVLFILPFMMHIEPWELPKVLRAHPSALMFGIAVPYMVGDITSSVLHKAWNITLAATKIGPTLPEVVSFATQRFGLYIAVIILWLMLFIVAVSEESLARALHMHGYSMICGPVVALIVELAVWYALHAVTRLLLGPIGVLALFVITLGGVILSFIYARYNTLVPCMWAHATYNTLIYCLAYELWDAIGAFVMAAAALAVIVMYVYRTKLL